MKPLFALPKMQPLDAIRTGDTELNSSDRRRRLIIGQASGDTEAGQVTATVYFIRGVYVCERVAVHRDGTYSIQARPFENINELQTFLHATPHALQLKDDFEGLCHRIRARIEGTQK